MRGQLSKEIRLQIVVTKLRNNVKRYHLKIQEQANLLKETDLLILYKKLLLEREKPFAQRDRKKFEDEFDLFLKREYPEHGAERIKKRMQKHKPFLFTCLDYEDVLPENNTAERAIRPQVIMRKIFGGSRSIDGATAHAVNSSVIETMRKQNPDVSFFDFMLPLLEKRVREEHEKKQGGHSVL